MAPDDFKAYLKGLAGSGVAVAQLDLMASVAAESAFAAVWGAYPWSVRRGTATITTTASQGYTILPADMEAVISIRYVEGTNVGWAIDLREENAFDTDFPNPAFSTGIPRIAKVVYHSPAAGDKWRIYWFPVPDAAYAMPLSYNRVSQLSGLPNVSAWMLDPILQYGAANMMPSLEARMTHRQMAQASLAEAMRSDRPVTGVPPQYGPDVDLTSWEDGRGGSTRWDPHAR